ncbi:MAG: hypothetical protein J5496_00575 [Lachnospiraceae bacterium]|nr:hypothetical protein [Lachnospiraceae bacterium]
MTPDQIFEEMVCDAAGNMNELLYHGHWNAARDSLVVMKSAKEEANGGERAAKDTGSKHSIETATDETRSPYPTITVQENSELARLIQNDSRSATSVIRDYLFEKYGGQIFNMSDGRKAIMDKSDARKIATSNKSDRRAMYSSFRDIVEKAAFDHEESTSHDKFDRFYYYGVDVKYGKNTLGIWVNVGHGKFDGKDHIYALTNRERSATRPVGTAIPSASLSAESVADAIPAVKEKFSMDLPVERTDRLIALHNMNEDAVRGMLELGGLAMPSVAITRVDMGHNTYGPISAVYGRDSVDPKNRKNRIYSGDAWTPTFPDVGIKINTKAAGQVQDKIKALLGEDAGELFNRLALDSDNLSDQIKRYGSFSKGYKNGDAFRLAFLRDTERALTVPKKVKQYTNLVENQDKDPKIIDFDRGTVRILIGDRGYTADVLLANEGKSGYRLHDIYRVL